VATGSPRLAHSSLPWQQELAPAAFCMVPLICHPQKPPGRPKHLRSIRHTSQLVSDFVQILGSKFWALGGLNQKIEENSFIQGSWRTDGQKMARFHRETKKKNQFEVCDKQTDRQTESIVDNNDS